MPGVGSVFVSHASEDNKLCVPLLAALDAWEIPYYYDAATPTEPQLSPAAQRALAEAHVFIRVCTTATNRSMAVALESNAFRGLQAAKQRGAHRALINLILDAGYQREPFDNATLFIDATTLSRFDWMSRLARALGITTVGRRLSRRSALGVGVASAVALASATSAGVVLKRNAQPPAQLNADPASHISKVTSQAKWTDAKTANLVTPSLAFADGVLYVYTDVGLQALRGSDKHTLWSAPDVGAPYVSRYNPLPPTVANGMLYLVDGLGDLNAVRTKDGQRSWHVHVRSAAGDTAGFAVIGMATLAEHAIYLVGDDAKLHSYNASNGAERWSAAIGNIPNTTQGWPTPAGANGLVYIGSTDHHLYALSAADGSVKWKYLTSGQVYSMPAIVNGVVYFGSEDGYFYALRGSDGKLLWRYQTDGDIDASPTVVNGVVYIGSHDGYLYALDATTGAAFWRALAGDPASAASGGIGSSYLINSQPVVDTYSVYVTAGGFLFAFSIRDGKQFWRFKSSGDGFGDISSPVLGASLVYFAANDQTIYAINT